MHGPRSGRIFFDVPFAVPERESEKAVLERKKVQFLPFPRTLVAQLTALGQPPPGYLVRMRMFKCGLGFDTIKFDLEDKPHLSPAV